MNVGTILYTLSNIPLARLLVVHSGWSGITYILWLVATGLNGRQHVRLVSVMTVTIAEL